MEAPLSLWHQVDLVLMAPAVTHQVVTLEPHDNVPLSAAAVALLQNGELVLSHELMHIRWLRKKLEDDRANYGSRFPPSRCWEKTSILIV